MKHHLVPLLCILIASCAPRPGVLPRHVPLEIPPKARAVETGAVRSSTAAASREGTLASARVGEIAAEVADLEESLAAAAAEAGRLREQKSADSRELDLLWKNLTGIHRRHQGLIADLDAGYYFTGRG